MRLRWICPLLCPLACGPQVGGVDGSAGASSEESGPLDTSSASEGTSPDSSGSGSGSDAEEDVGDDKPDFPPEDDPDALDVLFVIDNSARTADLQLAMGEAMPGLVARLSENARSVQVMFTTTDVGNPSCTPFQAPGYAPALGSPIATGCNARIDRFTGLGAAPDVREDACTSLCPVDVVPAGDPFVAFDTETGESNVGAFDAVGDALACLLPQGIDGCGYESPLEAMLLALNPGAEWNVGDRPFLREGADLAIVIVTDEADCSIADYSVMDDDAYFEVNPDNGNRQASSALCWNAGVTCEGPDVDFHYWNCMSVPDGPLHPVARYADLLASISATRRVSMLAVTGVPQVSQYDAAPPYLPTAGGLAELQVRDWQEADVFPSEIGDGIDAEDRQFDYGIGPACMTMDGERELRGIPNPRLVEVCQSLDGDEPRCCIDSVCGDPDAALRCLVGVASQ